MLKKLSWMLLACGVGFGSAQAAELQVSGGELTGALGVSVGGTLYDVEFLDGTCAALFSGCDEASDFTFTTSDSALQASQELLNQVFVNGPDGNFDTQPELTVGCEDLVQCRAWTPWTGTGVAGEAGVAINSAGSLPDSTSPGFFAGDFTDFPFDVFARWSLAQVQPAPAPGVLPLLMLGLLALGWSRLRSP